MITAVPEEQAAAFALLRRPQLSTDVLPDDRWDQYQRGRHRRFRLNPSLARRAHTTLGNVWVIPGDRWICLSLAESAAPSALDGGGMVLNSITQAIAGRIITWTSSRSGDTIVHGLVPDGVAEIALAAADGSTTTVRPSDNTYGVVLGSALASVRIGGQTVLELGVPEQ